MKHAYINGIILDGSKEMEPQRGKVILTDGEKIEVAEGDHFPEQEEASAPSWQYIIEGCNVVQ